MLFGNEDGAHKRAIAAAFSKAAPGYDEAADLQRETGERLMAWGGRLPGMQVLDAGCGTGYFSRCWQAQGYQVIALDLAAGMLAQAQRLHSADRYLLSDIEAIALPNGSVDHCFSNLVVQWCSDLRQAVGELYRVTRPRGMILFSTLMAGSLAELAAAWRETDGTSHVNSFLSLEQILAACRGYSLHYETDTRTLFFPQVIPLMRSLQGIGATHLYQGRSASLMGRQRIERLQAAYPRHSRGYPLTYQLFYGAIVRE